jgi:hypothetical protein
MKLDLPIGAFIVIAEYVEHDQVERVGMPLEPGPDRARGDVGRVVLRVSEHAR